MSPQHILFRKEDIKFTSPGTWTLPGMTCMNNHEMVRASLSHKIISLFLSSVHFTKHQRQHASTIHSLLGSLWYFKTWRYVQQAQERFWFKTPPVYSRKRPGTAATSCQREEEATVGRECSNRAVRERIASECSRPVEHCQ